MHKKKVYTFRSSRIFECTKTVWLGVRMPHFFVCDWLKDTFTN